MTQSVKKEKLIVCIKIRKKSNGSEGRGDVTYVRMSVSPTCGGCESERNETPV
jgi:hypothetical protein